MATESPLKLMKTGFCFILKAIFVLKIFKFGKIRLISKLITSQPGKQAVANLGICLNQ